MGQRLFFSQGPSTLIRLQLGVGYPFMFMAEWIGQWTQDQKVLILAMYGNV